MVFFNYATMQMAAKIVYYGPGLCGKTTNLQHIYQKTSPKSRGEMVSLETETDRTLFFDLLPLDVGNIAGFKTRFQLYTVPGQVFYNSTRKLVLRGVDGIVFVADSQTPMMDANIESFNNLKANLAELGLNLDEIPLVLQYNKRDLKNVATVEDLNRHLNPRSLPHFEASAVQGSGVFETLKGISKATLIMLRKRALGEDKVKIPEIATKPIPERPKMITPVPPPPPAAVPPTLAPATAQSKPAPGPAASITPNPPFAAPASQAARPVPPSMPVAQAAPAVPPPAASSTQPPQLPPQGGSAPPPFQETPVLPTAAEIAKEEVEFSELRVPSPKPSMKKIAVKTSDVGGKLDALREMYTGKPTSLTTKEKKDRHAYADPLSVLLGTSSKDKEKRGITKKLKIRLDPAEIEAVKNLSVDFHLTGGNIHKRFSNALNVSVEGKTNPKRVVLRIELEIIKK